MLYSKQRIGFVLGRITLASACALAVACQNTGNGTAPTASASAQPGAPSAVASASAQPSTQPVSLTPGTPAAPGAPAASGSTSPSGALAPALPGTDTGAAVPGPPQQDVAAGDTTEPIGIYAVFGVKEGDVLNVRAQPDSKTSKVFSFGPTVHTIRNTGRAADNSGTRWLEVSFEGGTGWVSRNNVTEFKKGGGCGDAAFSAAIRAVMRAIASNKDAELAGLVSPARGLVIHNSVGSPAVRIPAKEIEGVFGANKSYAWGEDSKGKKLSGSFKDVVLPSLSQAVGTGSKEQCGKMLNGGTAGPREWPAEFSQMNFASFYFPAGGGADWRTWAAGFEYVDGKPYLAVLVGYQQ